MSQNKARSDLADKRMVNKENAMRGWVVAYVLGISLILLFWVERSDTSQYLTILISFLIAGLFFLKNKLIKRISLILLLIFLNPLLSALAFTLEAKIYKALMILGLLAWWILTDYKKLKDLFKVLVVCNLVFCGFLIGKYATSSWHYETQNSSPPIAKYITQKDANRDIYIIIMDAFSSNRVLKKYIGVESEFQKFLLNNDFKEYPSLSKYYYTDQSLPNIFSGLVFPDSIRFTTQHMEEMQNLVPGKYLESFASNHNYNLETNSVLIEPDDNQLKVMFGRGSDISVYFFSPINRFFKLIGYVPRGNKNSEIEEIAQRNYDAIHKSISQKKKQIGIYHFLTFHMSIFDQDFKEALKSGLEHADAVGIKAVSLILKEKPEAKIIVLSDHGERSEEMLKSEYTEGILFVKN